MTIKKLAPILLAMLLGGLANSVAQATPWGIAKDAEVKTINGRLRVCIPSDELKYVVLRSITVSESFKRNGVRQLMWKIELNHGAAPVTLEPGVCVAYGEDLPGYKVISAVKSLDTGTTYYFRLNAIIENPRRDSTTFYDAVFCPVLHGGEIVFLQYRYKENGEVEAPKCGN